jgi:hypothetical protein
MGRLLRYCATWVAYESTKRRVIGIDVLFPRAVLSAFHPASTALRVQGHAFSLSTKTIRMPGFSTELADAGVASQEDAGTVHAAVAGEGGVEA